MPVTLVTFRIGESRYAVPLEIVSAVVGVPAATAREGTVVEGERRLPIVDGARLLGSGVGAGAGAKRGVVMELSGVTAVLLVDSVEGVDEVDPGSVHATPGYFSSRTTSLVRGLVKQGGEMTILLRPEEIPVGSGEAAPGGGEAG